MGFLVRLAAALAATAAFASAQTYTECDPLKKTCPDDPALSGKYNHNYASSKGAAPDFKGSNAGTIYYQGDGAHFQVKDRGDSPTIISNFYFMYGRYEVRMKSAKGKGIVSSIVMQSDVRDEIDWELLGSDPSKVQTNYFGKGNTDTYDRMIEYDIGDAQNVFRTYTIDWTAERVQWIVDGKVIRTLTPGQVSGDYFPQTPMTARLGNWAGGDPSNAPGTIQWAKGPTDFSDGPFDMIVEYITVQDYSTGKFYKYTDNSGSAKSIQAVGGKIMGGDKNADSRPPLQDKPEEEETGNESSTTFRAPSNSGRVTTPVPTSTSSSDSESGSEETPLPTNVVPVIPINTIVASTASDEVGTVAPAPTDPGSNEKPSTTEAPVSSNTDGKKDDTKQTETPEDSAAGKTTTTFALFALVAVGAAFVL